MESRKERRFMTGNELGATRSTSTWGWAQSCINLCTTLSLFIRCCFLLPIDFNVVGDLVSIVVK